MNYLSRRKNRVIVLDQNLLKSKVWLSLNGISKGLYLLFMCRRKMTKVGKRGHERNVCTNSKELQFTYREAKNKYGITNSRFSRGIDSLIEKGFIDIIKQGALLQEVTLYGLSDRWEKYDTLEFEKKKRKKCDITRGFIKPKKQK